MSVDILSVEVQRRWGRQTLLRKWTCHRYSHRRTWIALSADGQWYRPAAIRLFFICVYGIFSIEEEQRSVIRIFSGKRTCSKSISKWCICSEITTSHRHLVIMLLVHWKMHWRVTVFTRTVKSWTMFGTGPIWANRSSMIKLFTAWWKSGISACLVL